ncbi:YdcF family protein [Aquamicrobium sp. LC103]|uniref:YdcF family protein n=1 Tax=Aquamicrobium sp. LC103 TaxID=1120658 RepID=UPI00069AE2FB|nr:YdcF family protein [Aquamicrobium sp. LC103]TKT75498.1 YdcF family protein [Aquamicrobium sp. LC103]
MGMFLAAFAFVGGFAAFSFHVAGLSTPTDPKPADAIIVLTGGHSRLDAAVDLLKSGKGRRLLISGVNPIARVADLQLATGGDARLFSCCVDIDHVALDTIGNAEESAKWVSSHSYGSVILVTNNYHMPRSLLEMQRLLAGAELQPYPVVNTSLTGTEWLSRPKALRVLLTEYTKYLAAVARGLLPRPSLPETPSIEASASAMVMD